MRVTLRGREERRNLETLLLEAEVLIETFVKINSTETQKKNQQKHNKGRSTTIDLSMLFISQQEKAILTHAHWAQLCHISFVPTDKSLRFCIGPRCLAILRILPLSFSSKLPQYKIHVIILQG